MKNQNHIDGFIDTMDLSQIEMLDLADRFAVWNEVNPVQFKSLIVYLMYRKYEFFYDPSLQFLNISNRLKKMPEDYQEVKASDPEAFCLLEIAEQILRWKLP